MGHEVYICYDDENKITAEAICHVFEENKFKCWMKSRDMGINHYATEITEAIKSSELMVLDYSETAKHSSFVTTEVDMAFSSNIPILVFRIDHSTKESGLEFFLHNQHWLDAYPNPTIQFRYLLEDAAKILEKPLQEPIINEDTIKNVIILDNSKFNKADNTVTQVIIEDEPKEENGAWKKITWGLCLAPIILFIIGVVIDIATSNQELAISSIVLAPILWFIALIIYLYKKYFA